MKKGSSAGLRRGALIAGALLALGLLERRRPLRRPAERGLARVGRNAGVGASAALAGVLLAGPLLGPLARAVEARRWGLLQRLSLPSWLEAPLAIVLLDYGLYAWHVALHRVPLLWRFHLVHHVDLDLDTTTAMRFHGGEIALSLPFQAAQVLLLGIPPRTLEIWQTLLAVSVLFHHSNVRLPLGLERALQLLVVTPRMHGIHHGTAPEETNSNWSSGLTLWDRLHGTIRLDVPQEAIVIGVPGFRSPAALTLPRLLAMPFRRPGRARASWPAPKTA